MWEPATEEFQLPKSQVNCQAFHYGKERRKSYEGSMPNAAENPNIRQRTESSFLNCLLKNHNGVVVIF